MERQTPHGGEGWLLLLLSYYSFKFSSAFLYCLFPALAASLSAIAAVTESLLANAAVIPCK